jgi:hypothetical protein
VGWRDKADQAEKLILEIKYANENGLIHDGQMAEVLHKKMATAQQLGFEAKQERLEELVRQHDTASNTGLGSSLTKRLGGNGGALLVGDGTNQSTLTDVDAEALEFARSAKQRLIATERTTDFMGIKRLCYPAGAVPADLATKALNEGTTTAGGFLVVAQFAQEMFAETAGRATPCAATAG